MIKLTYFEPAHFQALIGWIDSPEFLLQWGGPNFQFPLDESQLNKYMEGTNVKGSDTYIYSVIHEQTSDVIGHISIGKIDRIHQSGRVGKVLVGDEKVRGQGVGQKIMKEVLRVAFHELDLHRVSLGVFDFNHSAISCYEKAGFVKEGLLRDARKFGDEFWSIWEMSILRQEWEQPAGR
jgi:RimJ/RimL family protein N-acetyltransferase